MNLTADALLDSLLPLAPAATGYRVAFSGGLDSHVLLHLLASRRDRLPAPLSAVHVNHNLQPLAADWAAHCVAVCAELGVDCQVLSVDATADLGESPEAAARQARYRALREHLPEGEALVTAHHQDDQAETLLLQLLRGAGPKGLAAMPALSAFGAGTLVRPLLAFTRAALRGYADLNGLQWIEDPSNAQQGFDRNYLRHAVVPRLRERWPAMAAVLARSAAHQAETAQLLDELAAMDLRAQQGNAQTAAGVDPDLRRDDRTGADDRLSIDAGGGGADRAPAAARDIPLSVRELLALSAPRRANLLRYWLHRCGAPVPSTAVLTRIEQDLLPAAPDAEPQVQWGNVRLRRYRDALYLTGTDSFNPEQSLDWSPDRPLRIAGGVLSAAAAPGRGVACRHLGDRPLQVRFRRGGERLQPAGRHEHHQLKHLFQESGVPPWERERVPLLYLDDRLIAVAGYWVCEGFQASEGESGMRFLWSRAIVPGGSFW